MPTMTTELTALYREMLRIRRVEEALAERYGEQQMRCPMHLSIGQEAAAVGVCAALNDGDLAFSSHRAHAHYLAKGGDLNRMVAEIYGRATGCCGGFGGSMHLVDREVGFVGSTPIVGGTVPLAVGAAWQLQRRKSDRVAVAFFGDGCFEEGVVHEALNFAALRRLPLIFAVENNLYSVYTQLADRQPNRPLHAIAEAHGWSVSMGDGNDVREAARLSQEAVRRARAGEGPQFLELFTYRHLEHCGPSDDDHLDYRPEGELADWQRRCPIRQTRGLLDISDAAHDHMEAGIAAEVEAAFTFALTSPAPQGHGLGSIYAD